MTSASGSTKVATSTTQQPATGRAWSSTSSTSVLLLFLSGGLLSFICSSAFLSISGLGDARAAAAFWEGVPIAAFEWPVVAMGIAFLMNLLTLTYERASAKMPMVLVACYINCLAGASHWLLWKRLAPILFDRFGRPYDIIREVMWLHATPAMVYLLSMLSDMPKSQTYGTMMVDSLMIFFGLAWEVTANATLSWAFFWASWICWVYVVYMLYCMCRVPDVEVSNASKATLRQLQLVTMGVFLVFPFVKVLTLVGAFSSPAVPCIWACFDVIGKVIFTSSLAHGNFANVEERLLVAMKAAEDISRVCAIEELKATMEQKDRFMSGVSHELRTPLNGIIGLSDAILAGSCGQLSDSLKKTAATIKSSGLRLLNLINDILDAASMKAGTLIVKHEPVRLQHIASDVIDLCQPLCKRGVQLVSQLPDSIPIVRGDAGRIIQILYNLVGNACKFTHKGTIAIGGRDLGQGWVEMSVSDTGIGIPADKFASIFNQFEQVDMSTTRKYGGTGLGLSLVKDLVEAHEGTITTTSNMGVGTTFAFTFKVWTQEMELPLLTQLAPRRSQTITSVVDKLATVDKLPPSSSQSPTVSTATPASLLPTTTTAAAVTTVETIQVNGATDPLPELQALQDGPLTKLKVLSVDNDVVNQMVMSNVLTQAGYQVQTAMDGVEALEMLSAPGYQPDAIVLDAIMPGMDGYEVCRRYRDMFPNHCTPVIMVSAKSRDEAVLEALQSGSNDCVTKPLRAQELVARIQTHCNYRRSCRASVTSVASMEDPTTGYRDESRSGQADSIQPIPAKVILLEKQLQEVTDEAIALQDEVELLEEQLREARSQGDAADRLSAELSTLMADRDESREQLAATYARLEASEKELEGRGAEVARLRGELAAAEGHIHALKLALQHERDSTPVQTLLSMQDEYVKNSAFGKGIHSPRRSGVPIATGEGQTDTTTYMAADGSGLWPGRRPWPAADAGAMGAGQAGWEI